MQIAKKLSQRGWLGFGSEFEGLDGKVLAILSFSSSRGSPLSLHHPYEARILAHAEAGLAESPTWTNCGCLLRTCGASS